MRSRRPSWRGRLSRWACTRKVLRMSSTQPSFCWRPIIGHIMKLVESCFNLLLPRMEVTQHTGNIHCIVMRLATEQLVIRKFKRIKKPLRIWDIHMYDTILLSLRYIYSSIITIHILTIQCKHIHQIVNYVLHRTSKEDGTCKHTSSFTHGSCTWHRKKVVMRLTPGSLCWVLG
jgi:type III secretory pathway component EscV